MALTTGSRRVAGECYVVAAGGSGAFYVPAGWRLANRAHMNVTGTFEVDMQPEPPYHDAEGITHARASINKRFSGPLSASSKVNMLAARTAVAGSAAYVALEHIEGTLEGRQGTFAAVHMGVMTRGDSTLSIAIVPDSGTGELAGIAGTMTITVADGKHSYELDYSLPS